MQRVEVWTAILMRQADLTIRNRAGLALRCIGEGSLDAC
jgi:hypothetical protein